MSHSNGLPPVVLWRVLTCLFNSYLQEKNIRFFGNAQDKCKNQLLGYIQLLTCGASIFSGFMPSCIVGIQLCFSCKIYIAFNALDFFVWNRCLESFNGRSFFGMPVSLQMHIIMTSEILMQNIIMWVTNWDDISWGYLLISKCQSTGNTFIFFWTMYTLRMAFQPLYRAE